MTVLDIRMKILDREIVAAILEFEDLTPEERIILLEEYCEKYREINTFDEVKR